MSVQFSFKLNEDFINSYASKEIPWGFKDAGGNSLGEITFIRTYSRKKDDGTKEKWYEVCKRVIEGMYSIQKDWAKNNRLPWNDRKAQSSAQEAFDRMFHLKWTPPGRGLWMMGAPLVMEGKNSAALQNCAVISTGDIERNDPGKVFEWAMLALMYGVGVGADMLGANKNIEIRNPEGNTETFVVEDSREGWADSLRVLINSYMAGGKPIEFDYSLIRPKGAPLKSFGGKASGPDPLIRLHNVLNKIFSDRVGRTLDSETITDIFNLIGGCVIAGSSRRSAEIMMGEYDDERFLDLKNHEIFPERNSYDPNNPGWAWASNNSVNVPVGADYSKYVKRIADNGEPGFIWMDVARTHGRMIDPPDEKDRRIAAFNPCCVAPDTMIMTDNGPMKISEINDSFTAVVNGKRYAASKPWISGIGDIYRLTTKEGHEIKLTPEHRIMTVSGEWKQAQHLEIGEKIQLNHHENISWGNAENHGDGYLLGLFVGDGNFSKSNRESKRNRNSIKKGMPVYTAHVKVWDIVNNDADIADYAYESALKLDHRSDWNGWSNMKNSSYQSMSITSLTYDYNMNLDKKHDINHLESESSEFYRGFLQGIFDADGHVEGWQESDNYKGLSIRLHQSDIGLLKTVQRMLLRLGINSRIYNAHPEKLSLLPDGKGGKKYYVSKAAYRLIISADSALRYAERIGFMHKEKSMKLNHALSWRKEIYKKPFIATVDSFEFVERGEVWDTEVSEIHAFDANGIYAHNSEQPLESQEMCTLVTVHLQNAESKEDFLRTLKFAFLYAKTVTLVPTPWTKTNSVMQRNRRIGLSLTGITDVSDKSGLPQMRDWMQDGYNEVRRYDQQYSEWLCIRESNRVTTIKPEGSVSLLSGASPGIHWGPGGKFYLRAVRFGNSDPMLHLFRSAQYLVEQDLVSDDTSVVYFPMKSNSSRSEKEVTLFEKIGMAATAQRHWSDNGVSVTLSFDKEKETKDIVSCLHMYEGQLKSVSFLPMGNTVYPQQPYTEITEEQYESYIGKIMKIDFSAIYDGIDNLEASGEKYCSNDSCAI